MSAAEDAKPDQPGVIVIDMGKKKKKLVKQLRNGEGDLMAQIRETVSALQADGTASPGDTVVVIVEQKPKKPSSPFPW